METIEMIAAGILFSIFFIITLSSCDKNGDLKTSENEFILSSSAIGSDSLLPADYTCDGTSSTLPLSWSGIPEGTESLALIMHAVASPTDIHWYWVLYNIPVSVSGLPKNVEGIGTLGTNSVNDRREYAPPCSKGPGKKAYTLTLYALSKAPEITVSPDSVNRAALLYAIKDITISSARMTVYYLRKL